MKQVKILRNEEGRIFVITDDDVIVIDDAYAVGLPFDAEKAIEKALGLERESV